MSNYLKFCGCRMCRYGLHRPHGGIVVRQAVRRLRYATKMALRKGLEVPTKIGVEYTD